MKALDGFFKRGLDSQLSRPTLDRCVPNFLMWIDFILTNLGEISISFLDEQELKTARDPILNDHGGNSKFKSDTRRFTLRSEFQLDQARSC